MGLYIRIKNGMPFEHPIFEDNLKQAFPDIDLDNLPSEWARFVRIERPEIGVYDVLDPEEPTYELVDGVYKDVWHKRAMTPEEKTEKQKKIKDYWASLPHGENFSAWVFNEEKCEYIAPISKPSDGKPYFWQGTTNSWVALPKRPNDGKKYRLDYASATWVEIP